MYSNQHKPHCNQTNYKEKSNDHDMLGLDSTLYLAYRDIEMLLSRHLYPNKEKNDPIRMLDFGCGAGLSTQLYSEKISQHGFSVNITGVDLSEENLMNAKKKLPQAHFQIVSTKESLISLGKFDFIICIFVFVEMKIKDAEDILVVLHSKLDKNGILIVANTTEAVYHPEKIWYGFTADFPENRANFDDSNKQKYIEDQPVKVKLFMDKNRDKSFTFFDYFHSAPAYENAYQKTGFTLLETYMPMGKENDPIDWKSEKNISPYLIHILKPQFS